MNGEFMARRKERKKRREAEEFLRETGRLLKRAGKRVSDEARAQVTSGQAHLKKALDAGDALGVEQAAKALDDTAHRHLAKFKKSSVREYVESIGFAIAMALVLRTFVIEPFKIPSGSMIPTLEIGDQIFVNKFIYGLRVPFTLSKVFADNIPARGEVIVFIYPQNHDVDYIKRVVGVPGDVVEVQGGQIIINGEPVARQKDPAACEYWDRDAREAWQVNRCERYTETLGGHAHAVIFSADGRHASDFGPERVRPGHVFVMGDNRDNSSDSRIWGQVPLENIKGRAMFIWLAWSQNGINLPRFFKKIP